MVDESIASLNVKAIAWFLGTPVRLLDGLVETTLGFDPTLESLLQLIIDTINNAAITCKTLIDFMLIFFIMLIKGILSYLNNDERSFFQIILKV